MHDQTARPVCPQCGGGLFPRANGELECHQHGSFYPPDALDAGFGTGTAERLRATADRSPTSGRKCPRDRLAFSRFANASGSVVVECCARCGGVWLTNDVFDAVAARTPPVQDKTPAEARSLLGWAAVRSVLTPAVKAR